MMKVWIGFLVLLSVVVAGCAKTKPADWPALPGDSRQARDLVDKHTFRPIDAKSISFTPESVMGLLEERVGQGRVVGGLDSIVFWIWRRMSAAGRSGQSSFLLWGTYHDSGAQIKAFGDLVGPLGLSKLDAVCVEQFNADGRWAGVTAGEQAGDSVLLKTWQKTGARVSLEKLLHGQIRENYTAWKYGVLPVLMDLLAGARAADRKLYGCDMSLALQKRIQKTGMRDRLRELHCILALREELRGRPAPHRVAMLWGQGHLAPEGMRRFLPENALVLSLYVFGGRFSRHGLEADLAGKLAITDPLMVPVDEAGTLIVLLPDDRIGARKELKHDPPEAPLAPEECLRLLVTASRPGTLQIGDQRVEVSEEPQALTLEKGSHVFLFTHSGGLLAGAFSMPADGFLELDLDPEQNFVEVILHRSTR